jgi:hypothetical protein
MTSDPFSYRCHQCSTPLDELFDGITEPPEFCPGTDCQAKYEAKRQRRRDRWRTFTAYLATVPFRVRISRPVYPHEVTSMAASLRPNTPLRHQGGQTIAVLKRACNGCGDELGDATPEEIELVNAGRKADLPDVRGECLRCSALVQIAGVGLGDDVLYRRQDTHDWIRGTVGAISPESGQLQIDLVDGTQAVEVPHGFGLHEWCTLEELVEHRKVARA